MEMFDSSAILPTGPRGGGQGRRNVSPVWWTSDESSFIVSGLDERPDDELIVRDEMMEKMLQREQSIQMEVHNPPIHTAKPEHDPLSFANRLRRQPAAISLSAQYLESGKCSTRESHETGDVAQQTIHSTVATQDNTDGTNNRASSRCQLSADMNQPELVKISSGSRRASAQTAAGTFQAGVCEDIVDSSTGVQNGHEANATAGSSAEDTCTRSSIASEETASIKGAGNVTVNIGLLQHSEAPNLSPQHAEFWNVHSSGVRHESLLLPSRRDLSTPHHHIEEQNKPGRIRSFMAKLDSKVKTRVKEKRQTRGQAVMRVETAAHQAPKDHGARLVKIPPNSRNWRDPWDRKKAPCDVDSMLSRRRIVPIHVLQSDDGTNEGQPFDKQQPVAPGSPGDRTYRGNIVLGHAQAVRMIKPGNASLVSISAQKSQPFNIDSLSPLEADLMASAGAMAKSSRRTSVRTDDAQSRKSSTSPIDAAAETVLPMSGRQQPEVPGPVPGAEEHTVHPYKQPTGDCPVNSEHDAKFRQLVRRLETNDSEPNRDAGLISVQELSRKDSLQEAAPEDRSAGSTNNDGRATGRKQLSSLEHKPGYFSLNDPTQRRTPIDDGSTLTSPSKIPANPKAHPRDSGCPSLISDDGREPSDFPEDMADDHARAPIFQGPLGISACEKGDDASTAGNETPSEGSLTLVNISMNENERFSETDTNEDLANENASSCSGHGWRYREPRAIVSPLSFRHGNLHSRLRERHRGGRGTSSRQPNELTLYAQCAILRWLISTTDAPGTPGMWDESSMWWELLRLPDEYQQRYDDDVRAEMLRVLLFLSDPEEPLPEPSEEVQAFIRDIYPPSVPQEAEDDASAAYDLLTLEDHGP